MTRSRNEWSRMLPLIVASLAVACERDRPERRVPRPTAPAAEQPALSPAATQAAADPGVSRRVERLLSASSSIPEAGWRVEARDGIVTLSGNVPTLLAKQRAVELASGLAGVRSVVDRLRVTPNGRSDGAIEADLARELRDNPVTEAHEIEVDVVQGLAVLTGSVQSWQERRIAERIAAGIRGVRDVHNRLTFELVADRRDEEIASEVRSRLRWDARLDASGIDVAVRAGDVSLSGNVSNAAARQYAAADGWVRGVRSVDVSGLDVSESPPASGRRMPAPDDDRRIADAIRSSWRYDPRVRPHQPKLEVARGVATISGVVPSPLAARAAESDAANTRGVVRVESRLQIRPKSIPDESLRRRVEAALSSSAALDARRIEVAADGGNVVLKGRVATADELRAAARVASGVAGVREVENQLAIEGGLSPPRADPELRDAIEALLRADPFLESADELQVDVKNGVATLTGRVGGAHEQAAAIDDAYEGGARHVVDRLSVPGRRMPPGPPRKNPAD